MGQGLSQEQEQLVAKHLEKQEQLVNGLKGIIEQQARALEAMNEDDDDYDESQEVDHDGNESGAEEFDQMQMFAQKAESKKEDEPEVDAEESKAPDEAWNEEEEARNFQATKPWLGAMAPPSGYKKDTSLDAPPEVGLQLEYVYGYRSRMCRNNVFFVDADTIVYFAAGVGIVHNLANNTQKFFTGHNDDIISMDYHKDSRVVVTGQQGKTPAIYVWSVDNCKPLAELVGYHKRAVVAVAFSRDGTRIASVGLDDNHSVAVYDWRQGTMLAESKGDTNKILSVIFNSTKGCDPNNDFITVGSKHIKMWSMAGGGLKVKKGKVGRKGKRQAFVTVACGETHVLIGTQDGNIYNFKGDKLKAANKAANKMIISMRRVGTDVFVGSKDGTCTCYELATMKEKCKFDLCSFEPSGVRNQVRAIDTLDGKTMIIGTITSSLYTANINTGEVKNVVTGHFGNLKSRDPHDYGELWGLAPSPNSASFATCGDDGTIRTWDVSSRKMIVRSEVGEPALSCGFSPDGNSLAVGTHTGRLVTYSTGDLEEDMRKRVSKRRLPVVKYSPNGQYLAAGAADSIVDIYSVDDGYKKVGSCTGNSSTILHLDWTVDSKWIQTVSQAYELLFYEGATGKHNPRSRDLKDETWATQECTLGWNVQGIWPKFSDGSDINMVNKSNSGKLLASAEDSGLVKLFQYPCIGGGLNQKTGKLSRRPKCQKGKGHSSHVTNVNWLCDDSYVISTGGADLTVMQWRVVRC